MKISAKIVALLAGVLLLISIEVAISIKAFSQIRETARIRKHTGLVINRANDLLSELRDAETGQRGYALTGDESFLVHYWAVHDSIIRHHEKLFQLTAIGSAREHLALMQPMIIAKLAEMSKIIDLRRNHKISVVVDEIRAGWGKRLMDSLRSEHDRFIKIEEAALTQHEAEFQTDIGNLLTVIIVISIITILLAISFTYFIYRESRHRLNNLIYLETERLLAIQEANNIQLQQINANLQVSEEKLSVTLKSIGDAVMATDSAGCVTLLNPLAEELTGWTQTEAAGHQVEDVFCIINETTRQPVVIPIKATLKHGTVQGLANHTILIARDGHECAIADSCAPIRNFHGQVIGAVLVFRDVTKHRKIELELENTIVEMQSIKKTAIENSEYAESIINTVRESLIALDQDLRVVSVSRSFYEVFKVNPEETVGQLIYDLGNKQWNIPKLRELLETILPLKTTFDNYVVEHDFTTIGRRIMLLNARQIQRVSGKERIILLAIEDITERREIEKGLERARKELARTKISEDEAREYAESMINTVREPLIVLDQDLRVVSVSRSFYEFFRVKPEETVGQLIYDLGNKQWDIPKLRELLETILPHQATFDNYEVKHDFTTIGKHILLLNARQIHRVLGKERIILLAIEDITERRNVEYGLEKAHEELNELATELKRTTQAKSDFLANMSHELRTPLNSINGFSEVLYDETFGVLNEKQKRYVNNVLTSGKHLLLLINQILDMAKVESGKMKLTLSEVRMKNLLQEISLLVADLVSKKKIQLVLEIAEDLPDIEADELKVKEILYNLLSNAVKFTPDNCQIGMQAYRTGLSIEIVVWDTGVGIAPENMEKIFEGFFRVDTPYSRVTEGTGLGLPLSKKLVELHGGELSVESEGLNRGTLVRFTLPIVSSKI